jgi:hypothetical protein
LGGDALSALIFIANVVLTIAKSAHRSLIRYMLAAGMTFLALLYLIGIPFFKNLNADNYWWRVIHLWVEGAWERITASLVAFVILKTTEVERRSSRGGSTSRPACSCSRGWSAPGTTTTGSARRTTGSGGAASSARSSPCRSR